MTHKPIAFTAHSPVLRNDGFGVDDGASVEGRVVYRVANPLELA
jgi:hypothetical protein